MGVPSKRKHFVVYHAILQLSAVAVLACGVVAVYFSKQAGMHFITAHAFIGAVDLPCHHYLVNMNLLVPVVGNILDKKGNVAGQVKIFGTMTEAGQTEAEKKAAELEAKMARKAAKEDEATPLARLAELDGREERVAVLCHRSHESLEESRLPKGIPFTILSISLAVAID